jgi:hypothetical protein
MNTAVNLIAAAVLAATPVLAQAGATLRCNSALVSVNDSTSTVLRKCGEPAGRSAAGYVRATDDSGRRVSLPVEQWSYGPSYGMYHYLRFEGDRLVSIRSERG